MQIINSFELDYESPMCHCDVEKNVRADVVVGGEEIHNFRESTVIDHTTGRYCKNPNSRLSEIYVTMS